MSRIVLQRRAPTPSKPSEPESGASVLPPDLLQRLQEVCLAALDGSPAGPMLASRIQRDCLTLLRRSSRADVRVQVRASGTQMQVRLLVPVAQGRVKTVVLALQ